MEFEVFISGSPNGHQMWPVNVKDSNVERLYDGSKEKTKFVIASAPLGGKRYTYYHYLVYQMNDFGGREGAFFAMSVRLDAYCNDYLTIYEAMDTAFRKKIVGSIIQDNGFLKYTTTDLLNYHDLFASLKTSLFDTIGTALTARDFVAMTPRIGSPAASTCMHWDDATSQKVTDVVATHGSCSLSRGYTCSKYVNIEKSAYKRGQQSMQEEIRRLQHGLKRLQEEKAQIAQDLAMAKSRVVQTAPNTGASVPPASFSASAMQRGGWMAKILLGIFFFILIFAVAAWYFWPGKAPCTEKDEETLSAMGTGNADADTSNRELLNRLADAMEIMPNAECKVNAANANTYCIHVIGLETFEGKECLTTNGNVEKKDSETWEISDCDISEGPVTVYIYQPQNEGDYRLFKKISLPSAHENNSSTPLLIVLSFLTLAGCKSKNDTNTSVSFYSAADYESDGAETSGSDFSGNGEVIAVPYRMEGGVKKVNVTINDVIGVDMIVDTGCSGALISLSEARYLAEKGALTSDDILGTTQSQIADGSIVENGVVLLRKVSIGGKITATDVTATVSENLNAPLLLGNEVLDRVKSISIDNEGQQILFEMY